MAKLFDFRPLLLGVGLGDARRFPDALHLHVVFELDLGLVDGAGDGRCAPGLRRAGERDVALRPASRPRRGIEADPARAG
jgi:hypothetical protein